MAKSEDDPSRDVVSIQYNLGKKQANIFATTTSRNAKKEALRQNIRKTTNNRSLAGSRARLAWTAAPASVFGGGMVLSSVLLEISS